MAEVRSAESATIALPIPKIEVDVSLQQIFEHLAQEGFRPKVHLGIPPITHIPR